MLSALRALALLSTLLLSACVTPPHSVSLTTVQQFNIVDVSVEGIEVIQSWPSEEGVVVKAENFDAVAINRLQSESASKFPAMRAHFQKVLTERFKAEFATHVSAKLLGTRPVKAIVKLKQFDVPSVARRIFIDQDVKVQMDIDLVDKRTGDILVSYKGPFQSMPLFGGLSTVIAVAVEPVDPTIRMTDRYIEGYGTWLLRN
ncbi:hypothetical protein [Methylobacterium sp. 10]|uniref:hypothetical protein n=1 Tax=Methylobacterium sp. 10 TaxID=1101191 RepID=UPI000484B05E|nr:hypothetical protein [Methylobacterium sp. 10]